MAGDRTGGEGKGNTVSPAKFCCCATPVKYQKYLTTRGYNIIKSVQSSLVICIPMKITGLDWEGMWSTCTDPIIEHTLIIAEVYQEPYSTLAGVADVLENKKQEISGDDNVSINLLDSTFSEVALTELHQLPRLHSISVENVEFINARGADRVCRSKILHRRLSKEHRVKILRYDIAEDCECGENDCDGISALIAHDINSDRVFFWTPEKEQEMITFLSGITPLYTTFKSAPAGSLGPILASVLAVNTTLIAMDCSQSNHNTPAITEEGVEMVVSALEKNIQSRLALLLLHDNMNGPHISHALQTRLHRVLTRNAYLLSNPYLATCRINHNADVMGVEGFEDPDAYAMVNECLAEHLDDDFVLAL